MFPGDLYNFDGGASGGYLPAGREGKRAEPFCFALSPLNFHGAGGQGGKGFGGSLPSAAALSVYACQRVVRASGLNFVFALAPLDFPGAGSGVFGRSPPSVAVLLVCSFQRVGRANGVNCFFCPSAVKFSRTEGRCFLADLYNRRRRFWYMHASVSGGRVY